MKELNTFRQFINEGPEDIDIMGQKFNFNDICPGAHKLISDLADEYEGRDIKLGDLLYLANLHQTFFNLEKKALGPQGIDVDELNEIKRLYVEIHNITTREFGEDVTKDVAAYMNMHMDKIKKAGLKASEPGGSSDRNFEEGLKEEDYMDISEPGNPLYDLNNDSEATAELNRIADKYGSLALQLWITSGEYPQDY